MPMSSRKGYRYSDYHRVAFTDTLQGYKIGTDAYAANGGVFGKKSPTEYYRNFITEEMVLFCDYDCYVRWDNPVNVLELVPAGIYWIFKKRVGKLYVVRATTDSGNLDIWAEGNIQTDVL